MKILSQADLSQFDGMPILKAIFAALFFCGLAIVGIYKWIEAIVSKRLADMMGPLIKRVEVLEADKKLSEAAIARAIGHVSDAQLDLPQTPENERPRGHLKQAMNVLTQATAGRPD